LSTQGRGHGAGVARYMVVAALLTFVAPVAAQDANAWRAPFAAGQQARADGDHAAYAGEMAEVVRTMPAGHLNRPFAQYHAARGAALLADTTAAVAFLRQAWDEGIEALMISFAEFDSAFDAISDSREFRHVMGLAAEMEFSVQSLGGSVHLIRGAGSNVVAQVGGDGLLLVDTGYAPALTALRHALGGLSGGRVARLILTHPHEDHMGSAAALGAAANMLAHPGTTEAMREPYVFMEGVEMPPKSQTAYPDSEIASDTAFVSNGEEVRVAVTPAHTGADLVVYFTESRVAHFGDTYLAGNPMMFPGNEDADAFLDNLESLLDSMHPGRSS